MLSFFIWLWFLLQTQDLVWKMVKYSCWCSRSAASIFTHPSTSRSSRRRRPGHMLNHLGLHLLMWSTVSSLSGRVHTLFGRSSLLLVPTAVGQRWGQVGKSTSASQMLLRSPLTRAEDTEQLYLCEKRPQTFISDLVSHTRLLSTPVRAGGK